MGLVLTRRAGETIVIGDNFLRLTVFDVWEGGVELDIDHADGRRERITLSAEPPHEHELLPGVTALLCSAGGKKCRIRVTAPVEISVHRLEVYVQTQQTEDQGGQEICAPRGPLPERPPRHFEDVPRDDRDIVDDLLGRIYDPDARLG